MGAFDMITDALKGQYQGSNYYGANATKENKDSGVSNTQTTKITEGDLAARKQRMDEEKRDEAEAANAKKAKGKTNKKNLYQKMYNNTPSMKPDLE